MIAQTEIQLIRKTIIALVDENSTQQEAIEELYKELEQHKELLSTIAEEVLKLRNNNNNTDQS